MAFGLKGSRWKSVRAASLVVALALVMPSLTVNPAQAENDDSAWSFFKKRKKAGEDGARATTNFAHSGVGGKAVTATEIINDGSVAPFLSEGSAAALQAAEIRYADIVNTGGWESVSGGNLKKGSTGRAVARLNQRLFIEGYLRQEATEGEYAEVFTSATKDSVERFQRNHGLAVTGSVDTATLRELNVPAKKRLATIRANMPRALAYAEGLGSRYVVVNVPAMQIDTVGGGKVYSRHNAIVGRPSRPTPVVATNIATVRFNPYWNAPPSIVERDILPKMRSGGASRILNDMNIKVFDGVGGPEINPNRVNWRRAVVDNYHFRQEPGGANAMATAKIEFNSPFGIYLHDTPERNLFNTGQRFYSSGCVRVEKVEIFLDWILNGQDGIDSARIAGLAESVERLDVPVVEGPQLRVVYLTAWPGKNGEVNFRPDIYELDESGFVLGQPLPVGETMDGERFVLKPVPRSMAALEDDGAVGFFSFFRRSDESESKRKSFSSRFDFEKPDDEEKNLKPKVKLKKDAKKPEKLAAKKPDNENEKTVIKKKAKPETVAAAKATEKPVDKKKAKPLEVTVTKADPKAVEKKAVKKEPDAAVEAKKKEPVAVAANKAEPAPPKKAPANCVADDYGQWPDGCEAFAKVKAGDEVSIDN